MSAVHRPECRRRGLHPFEQIASFLEGLHLARIVVSDEGKTVGVTVAVAGDRLSHDREGLLLGWIL